MPLPSAIAFPTSRFSSMSISNSAGADERPRRPDRMEQQPDEFYEDVFEALSNAGEERTEPSRSHRWLEIAGRNRERNLGNAFANDFRRLAQSEITNHNRL